MSSTAGTGGGEGGGATTTPAVNQQYFCHQCNHTVSITPPSTGELACPTCGGGFLEEIENPSPNANPNFDQILHDLSPLFSSSFGGAGGGGSMDPFGGSELMRFIAGGGGGRGDGVDSGDGGIRRTSGLPQPDAFDPLSFLYTHLQNFASGRANIQLIINNNQIDIGEGLFGGGGGRGLGVIGDYAFGSGLEQLMQQLAENDPNRYGTPPAAKSAVEGLPEIKITKELLESDSSQCAVCKDEFELGVGAKEMPCKHLYHPDCIIPWLELHNSCPVCRYELPTDDPDYENRGEGTQLVVNRPPITVDLGGSDATGGMILENSPSPRTVERRIRISFPWSFRGSGTSDTNSGNNNSAESSGERGGPNSGNEPREPGLD